MIDMNDKKYFKSMLISVGALFVLTCFSIIYCILGAKNVPDEQNTSHVMSIVYMIFQLIMEAIVFYYAFKAMVNGSSLIKTVMYAKDDVPNKKCKRNALIILIISAIIAVYMGIIIFPVNIFLTFFVLGLKFALLNCFGLVAIVAVYFYCYPKSIEE